MSIAENRWPRATALQLAAIAFVAMTTSSPRSSSAEPWRLSDRLPEWLTVELHNQTRFEAIDEQFRAGLMGSDQVLSMRTGIFAEARGAAWRVGGELVDMRAYLSDDNTPLDTAFSNPLDILQAYVAFDGENEGRKLSLLLGRFTLDLGSRRFIARNRYRNTINAFTGGHLHYQAGDTTVDAFATLPVQRKPFEREALADNALELDTESFDNVFWGVYVRRVFGDVAFEPYVFGRHDRRANGRADLLNPGVRVVKNPAVGDVHFELEALLQVGEVEQLNHLAGFLHASTGYTFDVWAQPSLSLTFEYASGDDDPDDDVSHGFNLLYGVPRPEYGPTMIYLAFNRTNLFTPGIQLDASPFDGVRTLITARSFTLAAARDAWFGSGYSDPTGQSGATLGEQFEVRVQYDVLPGNVRLEGGFAHLWRRGFAVNAARGAPTPNPTIGYLQVEMNI